MTETLEIRVDPRTAATPMLLQAEASRLLDIDANRIADLRIVRRSIDARQKRVMVNLTLRVAVDTPPEADPEATPVDYRPVAADAPRC
ncbi:FAD-binding protein, partial [Parabacteroides distasonis]